MLCVVGTAHLYLAVVGTGCRIAIIINATKVTPSGSRDFELRGERRGGGLLATQIRSSQEGVFKCAGGVKPVAG